MLSNDSERKFIFAKSAIKGVNVDESGKKCYQRQKYGDFQKK